MIPRMSDLRLIVNADDLGLVPEIDSAIERCHQVGTITSATLMVTGGSVENAAAMARRNPRLGVGLHIDLVWGRPLSNDVPSLVGPEGRFHSRRELAMRAVTGRVRVAEVMREVRAQLARSRDMGVRPSHLDGHQHAQVLPVVSSAIAAVARSERLAVRVPWPRRSQASLARFPQRLSLALLCGLAQRSGLRPATAEFASVFDVEGAVGASSYVSIVRAARGPTLELMVHPSEPSSALRDIHPDLYSLAMAEGQALAQEDLRPALEAAGCRLVNFRDLG